MAAPAFSPDDEDPSGMDDQYYGSAAQLLPSGASAPAPAPTTAPPQTSSTNIPQYIAAPDVPPAAAAGTGTPASPPPAATDANGESRPASSGAIVLPTPPSLPANDLPAYQAIISKTNTDSARPNVAPKWWERLLGGAVGFGTGFKDGPEAGIRAGSAVTNRGENAALADQQATLAVDKNNLDAWQRSHDLGTQGYEQQVQQFGQNMQVAGAQQSQNDLAQRQANEDAALQANRDNIARQQSNADRAFNQEQLVHADALKQQAITNGFEKQRIGFEGANANKGANGPKTTVTPNQFQTILSSRDKEYANEDKTYKANLAAADGPADKAQVEQDHQKALDDLQDRWNNRLAAADPQGLYAPKGGAQPAVVPQSPPSHAQAPSRSVSLKAAMALPINKGKSAAQVTSDLQSRNYAVAP